MKVAIIGASGLVGKAIFACESAMVAVENMQEVNQFDVTPTMAINNYTLAYKNQIVKTGKELRRERRKLERKLKKSKQ